MSLTRTGSTSPLTPCVVFTCCSQKTEFKKANLQDMRLLFTYLEFCLEQIVKDNELGALKQGLAGGYVEPGPGGDPIRNPKVLPPSWVLCAAASLTDCVLQLKVSTARALSALVPALLQVRSSAPPKL